MTRISGVVRTSATLVALALLASLAAPGWRSSIAAVTAVLLFAVVARRLAARVAAARTASPSLFDDVSAPARRHAARPPDLEALERTLGWGSYSERDYTHGLRPVLRRMIAYKLLVSTGVDLHGQPDAARAALPESLAWIVADKGTAGAPGPIDTQLIAYLVGEIERL
ncbi:MAG: hypothetical protein ABR529_11840 [Actinomycetota bacterium]